MPDGQRGVKTSDILVIPGRSDHGVRTILHAIPDGKGHVFGVIDIESKDEEGRERMLHIIASHLEHVKEDLAGEANPPRRFETMLGSMNADMLAVAWEIGVRHSHVHGVVGLVTKDQLFLSGIGKLSALFLHKTADKRYSVYELDAQFLDGRPPEEERYFLTILDGELHGGDVFYVGTPLSKHALSPNELHDILVTLPPVGALQRIRQFVPPSQHYAAIGFSFTDEEKAGGPPKKANPIGSLEALQTSQEHTKTVLGESNAELSHLVKNVSLAVKKKLSAPGTRGAATVLKRIGTLMVSGVMMVVTAVSKLGANIFLGKKGAGTGGDFVPRRSGEGLTREKKALAIGVLACFLVGGILLYGTRGKGDKAKSETAFTDTVTQIEERLLSADSSLIYRNTEEARTDLVEAASLLETLPRDTAAHKTKADELGAKIAELEDKTRGITTVSPQTLATLEGGSPFTAVTEVSGRVYAFSENLDIYRLESLTSSFVKEEATKGILETVKTAVGEGANAIVLDLNKQIGRADFTAKTLNPLTSGTNDMLSVEDIVSYNGNIYALSSGSAQIVKMRPQGNVYEAGTAWITSVDSDLSQARALAIDGDIYILTTHDVVKLRSGKEIDWPHATIDPELKNPTDIWTDVTSKYLYILDPGESRILVMNKESGATEAQYTAPEIANAIGFTIEENANRILFFTKNQAFAFTADHLVR